jgi:hypothetical protein
MTRAVAAAVVLMLAQLPARGDLNLVRAEPNLEKRSDKALANAHKALDRAQKAYGDGDLQAVEAALAEAREALELSIASLKETGKNPRKSPKYFKRAEIQTRRMLRRLEDFRLFMGVDDRRLAESLVLHVQKTHEWLLEGIMSKK